MSSEIRKLGLIAGNGNFPLLFARAARDQNISVVAAAICGDTSPLLHLAVRNVRWFQVGDLAALFRYFRGEGVTKVIMAGQINPQRLFDQSLSLDGEFQDLFKALRDRKADTIFAAIAERLAKEGMELLDSTILLKKYLAPRGTLTKRGPSESELADITFGKDIAKAMGGLDVGQTVVIKEKAIVAIEAMEGTDRCICRGGKIARSGAVVVKMSKPVQDDRFDIPVVGPRTLSNMIRSHAGCLAIEAGKTLIIDLDQCVRMANKAKICILAV